VNSKEALRDDQLIRDHLDGSENAFKELVECYAPSLTAVLERMLNDYHLALDLAQEVFIKTHRMLPKYKFNGRFRSLLYAIAFNHARDALRKKKRSPIVFLDKAMFGRGGKVAHDPFEQHDLKSKIEHAMDKIQSPFKEALYLRDVAGLSYIEAAKALDCNIGTVKSRVNRGRIAFRDIYTGLTQKEENNKGGQSAS